MADLSSKIEEVASGPAAASADGVLVKQQQVEDVIKADQYLSAKEAAAKQHRGIRMTKLIMPGARGGSSGC